MRHGSFIYNDYQRRIIIHDKHGTYSLINHRGVEWAALDLVEERLTEGWYEDWDDGNDNHQWEQRAMDIVSCEWAIGAMNFLKERRDFEYEKVEVRGG